MADITRAQAARHTDYIVRVHATPDGYHATVRTLAPHLPADVIVDPRSPVGVGTAATAPAAILQAVIAARLPVLGSQGLPDTPNASEAAQGAPVARYPGAVLADAITQSALRGMRP